MAQRPTAGYVLEYDTYGTIGVIQEFDDGTEGDSEDISGLTDTEGGIIRRKGAPVDSGESVTFSGKIDDSAAGFSNFETAMDARTEDEILHFKPSDAGFIADISLSTSGTITSVPIENAESTSLTDGQIIHLENTDEEIDQVIVDGDQTITGASTSITVESVTLNNTYDTTSMVGVASFKYTGHAESFNKTASRTEAVWNFSCTFHVNDSEFLIQYSGGS